MPSRFVRPDTVVLKISNGDTLTVKRRLNSVDSRRLRAMREAPTLAEPAVIMAYLVDWSLVDDSGKRVRIDGESAMALATALDNLDEDHFDEIHAAVSDHAKAMKAERDAEKNTQASENNASAISASPFVVAGELIGSVR